MRISLALIAVLCAPALGAQVVLRGELVCRDERWPPLRHGLVMLRSSPQTNDITSTTGGFVLHLPDERATELRDHYLELKVLGRDTAFVRPFVGATAFRQYRGRGELWVPKIRLDEPCDVFQESVAVLNDARERLARIAVSPTRPPGRPTRIARRLRDASLILLPLATLATSLESNAHDTLSAVAGAQPFRATRGASLRVVSLLTTMPGSAATPGRDPSSAVFHGGAGMDDVRATSVWMTTGAWGYSRAAFIKPVTPTLSFGGGLQALRQVEERSVSVSSTTELPASLSVRRTGAALGLSYRPTAAAVIGMVGKLQQSRTEQLTQLVTVRQFRMRSGVTAGSPRLDERVDRAAHADVDLSATIIPRDGLAIGATVMNAIGQAAELDDRDSRRGLLVGAQTEIGAAHLGMDVLAGPEAPVFVAGASMRLVNGLLAFVGGASADATATIGIGVDALMLRYDRGKDLGGRFSLTVRSRSK